MPPRVLRVDPEHPSADVIARALDVLRAGGLVGLPTETVYGLAARALDPAAVARVYAAKGRPSHHPLIAHVSGAEQARGLAASWPARAAELAAALWPGPLTLVVARAAHVPAAVAGGADSIAVRAPAHPVARAVIDALGEPVAAPSANRFEGLSPTTAAHVVKELGDAVDLVLDAGPCAAGIESTVVDVRRDPPRLLRHGAIDVRALRAVVPDLEATPASLTALTAAEGRDAPGMGLRHYAPRARLLLAPTWAEAERIAFGLAAAGARVGLVGHDAQATSLPERQVLLRPMPREATAYARALFATLHALDDAGVDAIVVQRVPDDEAWWAVADRLARGASPAKGEA